MAEEKKKEFRCEKCDWRRKYIDNPKSLSGRIWKLHTFICPGWKSYQRYLKQQESK